MIDIARYIRKAICDAFTAPTFKFYGAVPPSSATTPYAVVSVSYRQRPVKSLTAYEADVTITMYDDFKEYGGRKILDEKTDEIISVMIPINGLTLPYGAFNHVSCKLISVNERNETDNSTASYIKTITFQSLITE